MSTMRVMDDKRKTRVEILYRDGKRYNLRRVFQVFDSDGYVVVEYKKTVDGIIELRIIEQIPIDIIAAVIVMKKGKTTVYEFSNGIEINVQLEGESDEK